MRQTSQMTMVMLKTRWLRSIPTTAPPALLKEKNRRSSFLKMLTQRKARAKAMLTVTTQQSLRRTTEAPSSRKGTLSCNPKLQEVATSPRPKMNSSQEHLSSTKKTMTFSSVRTVSLSRKKDLQASPSLDHQTHSLPLLLTTTSEAEREPC